MKGDGGLIYELFCLWAIPICSQFPFVQYCSCQKGILPHPKETVKNYGSIVMKSSMSEVQHAPQTCSIFRYIDLSKPDTYRYLYR